jgi:hypothetical protein
MVLQRLPFVEYRVRVQMTIRQTPILGNLLLLKEVLAFAISFVDIFDDIRMGNSSQIRDDRDRTFGGADVFWLLSLLVPLLIDLLAFPRVEDFLVVLVEVLLRQTFKMNSTQQNFHISIFQYFNISIF